MKKTYTLSYKALAVTVTKTFQAYTLTGAINKAHDMLLSNCAFEGILTTPKGTEYTIR